MSRRVAVMYGRPCLLPDDLSGLVHQLDHVLVTSSGCPFHTVGSLAHDNIWWKPMTNIKQTLDINVAASDSERYYWSWCRRLLAPARS